MMEDFLRSTMGHALFEMEFGEYFRSNKGSQQQNSTDFSQHGSVTTSNVTPATSLANGQLSNGYPDNPSRTMPPRPFRNQTGERKPRGNGGENVVGGVKSSGFGGRSGGGEASSGEGRAFDRYFTLMIPDANCGKLIGSGGQNIKRIREEYSLKKFQIMSKDQEVDGLRALAVSTLKENLDKALECVVNNIDILCNEVNGSYQILLTGQDIIKKVDRFSERIQQADLEMPSSSGELTTIQGNTHEELGEKFTRLMTICYGFSK